MLFELSELSALCAQMRDNAAIVPEDCAEIRADVCPPDQNESRSGGFTHDHGFPVVDAKRTQMPKQERERNGHRHGHNQWNSRKGQQAWQ